MVFDSVEKKKKKVNFDRFDWVSFYAFESYGVKIGLRSNDPDVLNQVRERLPFLLPTGFHEIDYGSSEHIFSVIWGEKPRKKHLVYKNEEEILKLANNNWRLDLLESHIRMTVAEFADDFVFLHAGAISYKDKGIIIPARSFSGKTTLVAELVGRGFEYYSDEYAVIDKNGLLHPFPKQLSMRGIINAYEQVDMDVEEFGGISAEKPVEIGLILISKFFKGAKFLPKQMTSGEGIIESIANSVSIRQNPQLVLKVLGIVMNQAKVVKTNRGEAKRFADKFIRYLDEFGL